MPEKENLDPWEETVVTVTAAHPSGPLSPLRPIISHLNDTGPGKVLELPPEETERALANVAPRHAT